MFKSHKLPVTSFECSSNGKKWLLTKFILLNNIALPRFVTRRHNFFQWFLLRCSFFSFDLLLFGFMILVERHCWIIAIWLALFWAMFNVVVVALFALIIIKIHEGLCMYHAVNCIKKSRQSNRFHSTWTITYSVKLTKPKWKTTILNGSTNQFCGFVCVI